MAISTSNLFFCLEVFVPRRILSISVVVLLSWFDSCYFRRFQMYMQVCVLRVCVLSPADVSAEMVISACVLQGSGRARCLQQMSAGGVDVVIGA